ncbi:hypothetical protein BOX15_Mlig019103g2, partial [Macrostomum lignano]
NILQISEYCIAMRPGIGTNGSWRAALEASSSAGQQQQQPQPIGPAGSLASITTGQLVQGTNGDIYIMVTPSSSVTTTAGSAAATVSVATTSDIAAYQLQSNAALNSIDANHHQHAVKRPRPYSGGSSRPSQQQQNFLLDSDRLVGSNSNSNSSSSGGGGGPVIASVVGNVNGSAANGQLSACCDREKRRKSSHNEVERRRRDKINTLINQLAEMMPAQEWSGHAAAAAAATSASMDSQQALTMDSEQDQELQLQQQYQQQQLDQQQAPWLCLPKSAVLNKAVDYFGKLQIQNVHLAEESSQLLTKVQDMQRQVELLEIENAKLKAILQTSSQSSGDC